MQKSNSVSVDAFPPQYATGCNGAYRGVHAARLETGKSSSDSAITPESKATWSKGLSWINHPIAYTSPVGCSG